MRTGTRTPVTESRTQYTFPRLGLVMLEMAAAAAAAARLRVLPAGVGAVAARRAARIMARRPVRLARRSRARAARMAGVLRWRLAIRRRRLLRLA